MINIPIFEPLDIPPDITYQISEDMSFYIFTKNSLDLTYQNFTVVINPDHCHLECYEVNNNRITNNRLFEEYHSRQVNELLWKISDCHYMARYLRLELIERIRKVRDENQLREILDIIKKYNRENLSDSDESA